MARQLLSLPVNIPWLPIAVSPDMIDTRFCNKRFPFTWRSSLALSIYEPALDEIPEEVCGQRITYIKATCTITGYQPSREETEQGYVRFPNVPTEALDDTFAEYFACYGVLLNVALFPSPATRVVLTKVDTITFTDVVADDVGLPNPLVVRGVSLEAAGPATNQLVDLFPVGGDGALELALPEQMTITLPQPAARVTARVVRTRPGPFTLTAFRGETPIGEATPGDEPHTLHDLTIDGTDIDRLVFRMSGGDASLVELTYFNGKRHPIPNSDFPRIVDVSPKVRDLYQAATETGEILTASEAGVKTDKTLTTTESSETGFKLGAEMPIPKVPGSKLLGEFSRKRTETEQDQWSVATDASRERRETQGTSTQLSQMYNLLSSYHVGTNRAAFLMLPRPHILQPTDHRTFIQGLRFIEGVQDFMLIVSRPSDIEGLCIEATLDTGHFPEEVTIKEPPEEFDESDEVFTGKAFAENGFFSGSCTNIESDPSSVYTVSAGWIIDRAKGDAGHPGVSEIANNSNGQADRSLERYDYRANSDVSVQVSGRICGQSRWRDKARFERTYRVFTRSEQPKPSSAGPTVETPFLITSRSLCACFRSADPCPIVVPVVPRPDIVRPGEFLVEEPRLKFNAAVFTRSVTRESRSAALKDLLRKIQNKLTTSGRLRTRYPAGMVTFLDSDFFAERVRRTMPERERIKPIGQVRGLAPSAVSELGARTTLDQALSLSLPDLAARLNVPLPEAAGIRHTLLSEAAGGDQPTGSTPAQGA